MEIHVTGLDNMPKITLTMGKYQMECLITCIAAANAAADFYPNNFDNGQLNRIRSAAKALQEIKTV
jgi:hypothetical protein